MPRCHRPGPDFDGYRSPASRAPTAHTSLTFPNIFLPATAPSPSAPPRSPRSWNAWNVLARLSSPASPSPRCSRRYVSIHSRSGFRSHRLRVPGNHPLTGARGRILRDKTMCSLETQRYARVVVTRGSEQSPGSNAPWKGIDTSTLLLLLLSTFGFVLANVFGKKAFPSTRLTKSPPFPFLSTRAVRQRRDLRRAPGSYLPASQRHRFGEHVPGG
jgi:hypothetical protein